MGKKYSKVGVEWISKNGKEESKITGNKYRKHKNGSVQQVLDQRNGSDKGMKMDRNGRNK